jgi:pantoate--beta-alanine ligase
MRNTLLDVGNLGRIPVSVDYVAAVDPLTLKPVETITGPTVLAVAARVGMTRLIDNVVVKPSR